MNVTYCFYLIITFLSASAWGQSIPQLNSIGPHSQPTFAGELSEQLKKIEVNAASYRERARAFMGTASHGFAETFNCVEKSRHVEAFIEARELAAYVVAFGDVQRLRAPDAVRNWLVLLREPVAKDILGTVHLWSTAEPAPELQTAAVPLADVIFSWQKFGARALPSLNSKCLTNSEVIQTLIYVSLLHQTSWLPAALSEAQLRYLARQFAASAG